MTLSLFLIFVFSIQVGAPPELVARLGAARQDFEARQRSSVSSRETSKDPELDQFMVIISKDIAYYFFNLTFILYSLIDNEIWASIVMIIGSLL